MSQTTTTTTTLDRQVYYQCTTGVLPVYYRCTTGVLPVYYRCATGVLPLYYRCATGVLPLYYHCTTTVLPLYYHCTTGVPGVPGVLKSVLASWASDHTGSCCRDRLQALTLTFGDLGFGWAWTRDFRFVNTACFVAL